MNSKTKLQLIRGDDEARKVTLQKRSVSGNVEPLNLEDYTQIDFTAKDNDDIVLHLQLGDGIEVIDATSGQILLTFHHSLTAGVEWDSAKFDLQLTDKHDKIKTVLFGDIQLKHDITQ